MDVESISDPVIRAGLHAALADVNRLRIVDMLSVGDLSASELGRRLEMPSNLLAHHLKVLEAAGVISRHRSEGDGRRSYLRLESALFEALTPPSLRAPQRVVFVCTANSARSQLAAALWRQRCAIPVASAGTHPAERVAAGALSAAERHGLSLHDATPRKLSDVEESGDMVITVCDLAHEEIGDQATAHWSIPDPVREGSDRAFDHAFETLAERIEGFLPRIPDLTSS